MPPPMLTGREKPGNYRLVYGPTPGSKFDTPEGMAAVVEAIVAAGARITGPGVGAQWLRYRIETSDAPHLDRPHYTVTVWGWRDEAKRLDSLPRTIEGFSRHWNLLDG